MADSAPTAIIADAVATATRSPCAKSKRGAVVYDPITLRVYGVGRNGPPAPFGCSGDASCRTDCGKLCVHAEARAIRSALRQDVRNMGRMHLLHAKAVGGVLVPGGGPSCWQCSREILDAGIAGVWLYEETRTHPATSMADGSTVLGEWRFYAALDFHRATLTACKLTDTEVRR